jgi:hypothetical protein
MLELRPICENCARPLAPDSTDARICSFECTFCADCVDGVLDNVCPNCGGGFVPRPIRPAKNWKNGNSLGDYPPVDAIRHRPVDRGAHREFASAIRDLAPHAR